MNVESFYKPNESKDPVLEHIECHREHARLGDYGTWGDWIKEELANTMKANPLDPHHVLLDIIKDLHSTNLTRQNQILELRDQVRKAIGEGAGYADLKAVREEILDSIKTVREHNKRGANRAVLNALIDKIHRMLEPNP